MGVGKAALDAGFAGTGLAGAGRSCGSGIEPVVATRLAAAGLAGAFFAGVRLVDIFRGAAFCATFAAPLASIAELALARWVCPLASAGAAKTPNVDTAKPVAKMAGKQRLRVKPRSSAHRIGLDECYSIEYAEKLINALPSEWHAKAAVTRHFAALKAPLASSFAVASNGLWIGGDVGQKVRA